MSVPTLTLVVARARNNVIGKAGALPWRAPSDMQRFKSATMGKPVLMGRKTWATLRARPLPGRANIVITRDPAFRGPGAFAYSDLAAGLAAGAAMADRSGADDVCVIGGADIFAATLPFADRIVLTEIDLSPAGDVRLPAFDESAWREVSREHVARGPRDDASFSVRTLQRARSP
ncbi:MAG: dihydrofolate reductase [Hyphomonadaceae bacterium]|nr:dihydrofolate reductase [Hyphomonadaceae bacterium]